MTRIEFNTHDYTSSHGTNPKGRGSWAFQVPGLDKEPRWFKGTYAEAKKQARDAYAAFAKGTNIEIIEVEVLA